MQRQQKYEDMNNRVKGSPATGYRLSGALGRMVLIILLLSPGLQSWAQEVTTKSFWNDPVNDPMTPFYVVAALMVVTLILVLVVAIHMLQILTIFVRQAQREKSIKLGLPYAPEVSWWTKMWDQFNASVPVTKEKDIDLGHEYDGIRELDNHLPPWWKGLLYGSIVWAAVYLVVYHLVGSLPLSGDEYENEVSAAAENLRMFKASQPVTIIDENTLAFTKDEAFISNGKKVFMSNNCGSCHRNDGGGNAIGPNLTDKYWIHNGAIKNIFLTIKAGVVEKGMPAWGKVMSPTDVRDVTFFVMSLQGSNPKEPKKPQGNLYAPAENQVPADTVKGVANP